MAGWLFCCIFKLFELSRKERNASYENNGLVLTSHSLQGGFFIWFKFLSFVENIGQCF